jgi:hypothetical protein
MNITERYGGGRWDMIMVETYRDINDGRDDKRPVTAEMSVGDVSTQDRSDPNSSHPIGDIVGSGDGALVELLC